MDESNVMRRVSARNEFREALADPDLDLTELQKAAWKLYEIEGFPYGASLKGLARWIDRIAPKK